LRRIKRDLETLIKFYDADIHLQSLSLQARLKTSPAIPLYNIKVF